MQATCPNDLWGAVYNLGAQHVGRKFPCKKCGVPLTVGSNGLHFATDDAAAPPPVVAAQPVSGDELSNAVASLSEVSGAASRARRPHSTPTLMEQLPAEFFTYLLLAGSLLVVIFLFLPLVDHAAIGRAEARIRAGDAEQRRLDRALSSAGQTPNTDEIKRRDANRTEWKNKKTDMEEDVENAQSVQTRRAIGMHGE
jgi:hypothetical protein